MEGIPKNIGQTTTSKAERSKESKEDLGVSKWRRYKNRVVIAFSALSMAIGTSSYYLEEKPANTNRDTDKKERLLDTYTPPIDLMPEESWSEYKSIREDINPEVMTSIKDVFYGLEKAGLSNYISMSAEGLFRLTNYPIMLESIERNTDLIIEISKKIKAPCEDNILILVASIDLQSPEVLQDQSFKEIIDLLIADNCSLEKVRPEQFLTLNRNFQLYSLPETRTAIKDIGQNQESKDLFLDMLETGLTSDNFNEKDYKKLLTNITLVLKTFGANESSYDAKNILIETDLNPEDLDYIKNKLFSDTNRFSKETPALFLYHVYIPYFGNSFKNIDSQVLQECIDSLQSNNSVNFSIESMFSKNLGGKFFEKYYELQKTKDRDVELFKEIILRIPWRTNNDGIINFEQLLNNYQSFRYLEANTEIQEYENLGEFLKDSLLPADFLEKLNIDPETDKLLLSFPNKSDRYEAYARTVRAMNLNGAQPNRKSFEENLLTLENMRGSQEIREKSIFKDRNVLAIFHNESEYSFGTKKLLEQLNKQGAESLNIYRANKNSEDLKKVKDEILSELVKSNNPTIFFQGHGSPDAIYLSDGVPSDSKTFGEDTSTVKITVDDVMDGLKNRAKNKETQGETIFLISSCFSYNFLQKIFEETAKYNNITAENKIKIGFGIAEAEYGQFGSGHSESEYKNIMLDEIFTRSEKEHSLKLGDVIDMENDLRNGNDVKYKGDSNMSIFLHIDGEKIKKFGNLKKSRDNYLQIAQEFQEKAKGGKSIHFYEAMNDMVG